MKNIKQYISEMKNFHSMNENIRKGLRLSICDEVKVPVCESLRIGIDDKPEMVKVNTWDELRQIIEERFEEQGPGTKQDPINFNDIDVSGMTTFFDESSHRGLFRYTKFEYIDISEWDVSKVETMYSMFNECKNLKSIGDIYNWDTSRVKNMGFMFSFCENLESIGNLSNWNVSNVKSMSYMFYACESLKYIGDLSDWNISRVGNHMEEMFTDSVITKIPDWYEE